MNISQRIYLIRHGQTDFNLKRIVQGRGVDSSLNATGRKQAKRFYEAYSETPFSHVYMSSLKRTRESALDFINAGVPHSIHPEIDEIDWGTQEGVKASPQMHEHYKDVMNRWASGDYRGKMPEGESPLDVQDRVSKFLTEIFNPELDPVLIVSHGRTMRIMLCTMLDEPLSKMEHFVHGNLGLYILHRHNEGFSLDTKNCSEHLNSK